MSIVCCLREEKERKRREEEERKRGIKEWSENRAYVNLLGILIYCFWVWDFCFCGEVERCDLWCGELVKVGPVEPGSADGCSPCCFGFGSDPFIDSLTRSFCMTKPPLFIESIFSNCIIFFI